MYRKSVRIAITVLLGGLWIWLAWGFLSARGVTLLNLLFLAMTAIIIFLPLYKKFSGGDGRRNGN